MPEPPKAYIVPFFVSCQILHIKASTYTWTIAQTDRRNVPDTCSICDSFYMYVLYCRSLTKLLAASVTPTADSWRCVYYSLLLYCVALISPSIKYIGSLFRDAQTSQHAIRRKRNFTRANFRPIKAPALFRAASCGPTLQRRRFCRVSQSHVFRARAAVEYAREAPLLVPLGGTGGEVISHARKKTGKQNQESIEPHLLNCRRFSSIMYCVM